MKRTPNPHRPIARVALAARATLAAAAVLAALAAAAAGALADATDLASTSPASRPYPLETCIVTGEPLGGMGAPVTQVFGDREVRFCCEGCVAKFESDPAGYLARIDEELIALQGEHYPLSVCPVSGGELRAGEAVEFLVEDRLVRACSEACREAVEADPQPILARIEEAAIARQLPDYPLETCVVAGGRLGSMGEPVEYLHQGRLVRFCCAACIPAFEKDPGRFLAMIDEAAARAAAGEREP